MSYNLTTLGSSLSFPEQVIEINNLSNGMFGFTLFVTLLFITIMIMLKNGEDSLISINTTVFIFGIIDIFMMIFKIMTFNTGISLLVGCLVVWVFSAGAIALGGK